MSGVLLTDANFEEEVLNSETPVLVDFFAAWCGPCRLQGPIVEELAGEIGDKAKIGKLDVDASPQTAQKYGIMSIPTIMIFKSGEPVQTLIGLQTKEGLSDEINKVI
ncbi:MAG: thioredoxin [Candidatus Buchananbacteria bacterium]